jgi:hypothetical protein
MNLPPMGAKQLQCIKKSGFKNSKKCEINCETIGDPIKKTQF